MCCNYKAPQKWKLMGDGSKEHGTVDRKQQFESVIITLVVQTFWSHVHLALPGLIADSGAEKIQVNFEFLKFALHQFIHLRVHNVK